MRILERNIRSIIGSKQRSVNMAKYVMCEKCKKVVEYKPETKYEGGTSFTTFKCPECGHVKITSRNHVHYGQDGRG